MSKEIAAALRAAMPLIAVDRKDFYRRKNTTAGMCLAVRRTSSGFRIKAKSALRIGRTKSDKFSAGLGYWLPTISLVSSKYNPEHYTTRIMWLELMAICAETGEFE